MGRETVAQRMGLREATLRDFCRGTAEVHLLAAEIRVAVERLDASRRRVHIEDLPDGEELTFTARMLARLCDAVLSGELPAPALEIISFTVIASDHMHWDEDEEVVGRVLYAWASPELNGELTRSSVRLHRDWLTGEVRPPSEPDVTADTLAGWGLFSRTLKVRLRPSQDVDG